MENSVLNWDSVELAANLHSTAAEQTERARLAEPRAGNATQTWNPQNEIPFQQRPPKSATAFPTRSSGPPSGLAAAQLLSPSSAAADRRARERGGAAQLCLSWPTLDWLRPTRAGVGPGLLRRSPLALREPASPSGEGLRERAPGSPGGRVPATLLPATPPRAPPPLPAPCRCLSATVHRDASSEGTRGSPSSLLEPAVRRPLTSRRRGGSFEPVLESCDCRLLILPLISRGVSHLWTCLSFSPRVWRERA